MPQLRGINYLRQKLALKKLRVDKRYDFYEMKNVVVDIGYSTPDKAKWIKAVLGWNSKAVDSLADRLIFKEFRNDTFGIGDIYKMNNPDVLYDSAILEALIASCSFIYISPDENGFPRMQVLTASNATGIIDPITGFLHEGYAVLERDDYSVPIVEAYFEPNRTIIYEKDKPINVYKHDVGRPLLVPIINRPDAKRPFGHSRISRACMNISEKAMRAVKMMEIAGEAGTVPQKYILGLSQDSEPMDKWATSMTALLQIQKDDDGDRPVVGQFQQQTMTPFIEEIRTFASLFAGETGLTLDDLGFSTGNPSSADAIKYAHENLRLSAKKSQRSFGSGFLNAGILAVSMLDNFPYNREVFYDTQPIWYPSFDLDASGLSGIGDAVNKVQQAFPEYFTEEKLSDLLGI